jgi:DTW domain-containing protein YfiP
MRTRTRVVIFQHPRERHVPINTARLARLCLPDSVLHRGVDLDGDPAVQALLDGSDGGPPPYVLYPGPQAVDLATERPPGPITLVVLDGTWWQANKLLRRNPRLAALPQLRLAPAAPSQYRIRREPHEHCVATIEAIALALRALEGDGDARRFDSLLAPFNAMVELQIAFAKDVQSARHLVAARARGPRSARRAQEPGLKAMREAAGDLVCVHGEANAWPLRAPERRAPEIVQWLAWRVATGETFSAVVAPRGALAPSAPLQLRLGADVLAAGEPFEAFRARWEAFLRPSDVLCGWGRFPTNTLERETTLPAGFVDVRVAANARLGARIGTVEECASRLEAAGQLGRDDLAPGAPETGRGGARMASLRRVVAALLATPAA